MNFASTAAIVRNLRNFLVLNVNYRRKREFIPYHRHTLCIETSSICNLKCRFCAYDKKKSARVNMTNDSFCDYVRQATGLGFSRFQLTPCTGDIFMDRQIFEKLEFLEADRDVSSYEFFTNFTIPTAADIDRLAGLAKLSGLTVSIYGHDLDSFVAITQSTEKVYRRLIDNLETLLAHRDRFGKKLAVGFRSYRKLPKDASSDLLDLLERFRAVDIPVTVSRLYNNWGGYITNDDVRGLDIQISESDSTYKKGACTMLFSRVQVTAAGIVNGCACRDVDQALRIGDLNQQPLREILSTRNEAYMQLIHEQQQGHFREVCRNCDFYKSIYRRRSAYKNMAQPLVTLEQFTDSLTEQEPTPAQVPAAA